MRPQEEKPDSEHQRTTLSGQEQKEKTMEKRSRLKETPMEWWDSTCRTDWHRDANTVSSHLYLWAHIHSPHKNAAHRRTQRAGSPTPPWEQGHFIPTWLTLQVHFHSERIQKWRKVFSDCSSRSVACWNHGERLVLQTAALRALPMNIKSLEASWVRTEKKQGMSIPLPGPKHAFS